LNTSCFLYESFENFFLFFAYPKNPALSMGCSAAREFFRFVSPSAKSGMTGIEGAYGGY